ncbi:MAG: lipid A deacylase LpxR family protein [Bacteroidia bacterium]|nr:lipid A deacylase LpxR family protein [Bacteroidia bacterium]
MKIFSKRNWIQFWTLCLLQLTMVLPTMKAQEIIHEVFPTQDLFRSHAFQFNLENDLFAGLRLNDDRNYTMGLSFSYSKPEFNEYGYFKFQQNLMRHLWAFGNGKTVQDADKELKLLSSGISLSNKSFTPEDLGNTEPVFSDRPYANITLVSSTVRFYDSKKSRVHQLSLSVGALGTPLAKWVQISFHEIHRFFYAPSQVVVPRGWDNQISNPGEPSIQIHYSRERYWRKSRWYLNEKKVFVDLRENMDAYLGYQTQFSYAMTARIGWKGGPIGTERERRWFAYARLRPQFIAYDALLQGQFRPSAYTLPASEINRFVLETSTGFGVSWPVGQNRIYTMYGFYVKSAEADFTDSPPMHYWGRLQLIYTW